MEEFYHIYGVLNYETTSTDVMCQTKNGKKHGLEVGFFYNGTPSKKIMYVESVKNGLAKWWWDDSVSCDGSKITQYEEEVYKNGDSHGVRILFDLKRRWKK